MATCGWCGRQTARSQEFHNGKSVLRLCPDCAENGIGQMSARLLHSTPLPDDDAIPPTAGWIVNTARLLLFAALFPLAYVLFHWLRSLG